MKLTAFHQLAKYITTYHFLSCFVVYLVVEVDAGSEIRTKQLLQNIRSHLAHQVDEVLKEKECDTGLTLCEPSKSKEEEEPEDDEDIPPPPKTRGHHKPLIQVNPKDVIQTMIHKVHKPLVKKSDKEPVHVEKEVPKAKKGKKADDEDEEEDDDQDEDDKGKKLKPTVKLKKPEKKEERKGIEFPDDIPVFAPTSNIVKAPLCRKHSRVYLRQLKRYKMWALMMYDASAKLPSGILQGNINQYGDFDECLSINAVFKNPKKSEENSGIQGKYCLANIDVTATNDNIGLQQAVYRSQSFAFVRSKADDPGHFIPRFSTINWGLCLPSSCPAKDIERSLELSLADYNETSGLQFDVKIDKDHCVTKDDIKFYFSFMTLLTILFYASIAGTAGYATYKDLFALEPENPEEEEAVEEPEGPEESKEKEEEEEEKKEEEKEAKEKAEEGDEKKEEEEVKSDEEAPKEEKKVVPFTKRFALKGKLKKIVMAFSLKRNAEKLIQDSDNEDDIICIHGIKAVFTIMLYFAHKTIPLALTPFNNRVVLTQISNEASSVLLRASIIYTDSFLLISGVLTSYSLYKEIADKGRISWGRRTLARFIRLTPALLAVVLFYAYIFDHLGSGPLWGVVARKNAHICQENSWKNLLYIQNFFAFEKMCAPQTHQLALDMQLSLLSPLMVYLLHRYDKIGFGALQALFLLSSIMRYISTSNNTLSLIIYHGMPVSQLYRTANVLYSQTLHRASPYILGVIIGYYLRKFNKSLDFPKPVIAIGWIAAFCFGFLSIVSPSHLADRSYQYDVDEAAKYAALSPIAWSMALGWVIVACHLGHGGKLNEILCNKGLLIFSRISYSVYLTQFLVFFYRVGVKRIPETFTVSGSFNVTEFAIVVAISIIVTLLFDLPMMEIKSILLDRGGADSSEEPTEEQPEGEENPEPQEGEEEEEINAEDLEVEKILEDVEYLPDEEEMEELEIEDIEELEEYEDEPYEEQQPLRRSSRVRFDDEADDKEIWSDKKEFNKKEEKKAEVAEDFWGKDED